MTNVKQSNTELLEAIGQAIRAEYEGHYFYKMAAGNTKDLKGQKVFKALAEEELNHAA